MVGVCVVLAATLVFRPMLTALVCALALSISLATSARAAFAFWWLVMIAVPFWIQLRVGPTAMPPQAIATILVLPAILLAGQEPARWRLRAVDVGFLLFLVASLAAHQFGGSTLGATSQLVIQGALAYIAGRLLLPAAGLDFAVRLIAVSLTVIAVWAILEHFTGVHVFAHLAATGGRDWASIGHRAEAARSEAAFGHPIALGGALALAIPFIFATDFTMRAKLLMLALIGGGVLCTLSRGPFLSAILGLLLVTLFGGTAFGRRGRVLLGTLSAAVVFVPILIELKEAIAEGGSQVANSTENRYLLYTYFPRDVRPLGIAKNVVVGRNSEEVWRSFETIDSTFIALGIQFGWIPLLFIGALFVALAVKLVRKTASVFQIALLAQLPGLATVALITQYRSLIFFLVGAVAATWAPLAARTGDRERRSPHPETRPELLPSHPSAALRTAPRSVKPTF